MSTVSQAKVGYWYGSLAGFLRVVVIMSTVSQTKVGYWYGLLAGWLCTGCTLLRCRGCACAQALQVQAVRMFSTGCTYFVVVQDVHDRLYRLYIYCELICTACTGCTMHCLGCLCTYVCSCTGCTCFVVVQYVLALYRLYMCTICAGCTLLPILAALSTGWVLYRSERSVHQRK
jgi:hypothetical protein